MSITTRRKHMSMFTRRLPRFRRTPDAPFWANPWLYLGGIGGLLVLWLLPVLVAYSPLVDVIMGRAASELNGRILVGSASLGWFSPVRLRNVEILDPENHPVLEIPQLAIDRSLLALLWDTANLGKVRLEGPKFTVVLRDDGSNLEQVFANYLAVRQRAPRDIAVEIVEGSIAVEEARTQRTWQIGQFGLEFSMPANRSQPWVLSSSGTVADGQQSGQFQVAIRMQQERGTWSGSRDAAADQQAEGADRADEIRVQAERVPLAMLDPLVRRMGGRLRLAGWVSADVQARWDSHRPGSRCLVEGRIVAEPFQIAGPMFGKDQPALARLGAEGRVAWHDGAIRFDRVRADSDVGSLRIEGTMVLGGRAERSLSGAGDHPDPAAASRPHGGYQIEGQLDLARLAALLPHTLRIQKETQITSGKVQWSFSGEPGREGMVWRGRLEGSNLVATSRNRQVVWQQPIQITLLAHETAQGVVIENLKCESNFLNLQASGTATHWTVAATFDASKLADQSRGFVDLGGLRVVGEGWAEADWKRIDQEGFQLGGQLRLNDFQWAVPGRPAWIEPSLTLTWSATGRSHLAGQSRLDTAQLQIESGSDWLALRLTEPIGEFLRSQAWPLEVHSRGQLTRWPGRLAPWLRFADCTASGSYELLAGVVLSADSVALQQARFTADHLELRSPTWSIREPRVEANLTGRWDWASRRLELPNGTIACAALSTQADRLLCAVPAQGPIQLAGTLSWQAALDRLQGWFLTDPKKTPLWRLAGRLRGQAQFRQSGGLISGQAEGGIQDLEVVHHSGQRYQEREVRFTLRGDYNDVSQSVHIEQAEFASATVRLAGSAKIAHLSSQPELQLTGQIDYDMDRFSQFLRSVLGEGIRLGGQGSSPIAYRGVWGSDQSVASGALGWSWAQIYGFEFGPGELRASLANGVLDIKPLDLECNRGRLRLVPHFRLTPQAKELTFEPGRVVDQVQITPAMCSTLLQYMAPLLAGVTSAQGFFSIDLEGCRLPLVSQPGLVNWYETEIAGKLVIHSAQIGPGYLIQEIARLLGRSTPAYLVRESVVPFRMTQGRIYHQQMELAFNELTVRSSGSVGLDQSLAMVVEMPVPPAWQQGRLLGTALKDQTIKLPISGFLRRPQIDRTAFDQAARQFLQNAAHNVFQDQMNRQLERLLRPPAKR